MKSKITVSICVALGMLFALFTQGAVAEVKRSTGQVTLRVADKTVRPEREKKDDDDKGKKDKDPKSESVTKTLEIQVSAAKVIQGPLKMVTFWYARDAKTKKLSMAHKEEAEVKLDENNTATVQVPAMKFTFTPAHTKGKGKDKEEIDAKGETYGGWVVRAYAGENYVGEAASSMPLLKEES